MTPATSSFTSHLCGGRRLQTELSCGIKMKPASVVARALSLFPHVRMNRMENVLSSRIVFECPIFKVEEADVRLASGSTAKRWYVVLPDGVSVVCLRNSRIIVLKELRSASQSMQWTLPGGVVEEGETSEQAAVREVIEETGLEPARHQVARHVSTAVSCVQANLPPLHGNTVQASWSGGSGHRSQRVHFHRRREASRRR